MEGREKLKTSRSTKDSIQINFNGFCLKITLTLCSSGERSMDTAIQSQILAGASTVELRSMCNRSVSVLCCVHQSL
eukprot:803405-Rhodomonas_salina.1